MAEFKLGRIRFVWQGTWTTGTNYVVDDVINNGGKSYICVINHTASPAFATDFGANPSKWALVSDGISWKGDWLPTTYYNVGDQVKYGGTVYVCKTVHTSATDISPTFLGLEADQAKWDVFATSFSFSGPWTVDTKYRVKDFVTYGGTTYVCKTAHISAATEDDGLELDQAKWDIFNQGVTYLGEWAGVTRYKLNDVVKFGADLWICTTIHTSTSSFEQANWEVFVNGLQFEDSWVIATDYQIGDIVTYGGNSYIAKLNNVGLQPNTNTDEWAPYTTGFNFRSEWLDSTAYRVGDVVRSGGYTYLATADSTGVLPPDVDYWNRLNSGLRWNANSQTYSAVSGINLTGSGTGATFDVTRTGTNYLVTVLPGSTGYASSNTIKILGTQVGGLSPVNDVTLTVDSVSGGSITAVSVSGISVTWTSGVTYVLGDVVMWGASSFICVSAHVASSLSRPDNDLAAEYWNLLASGSEPAVLTTRGDTFYYGSNGATRLPIGTDGQILRVKDGLPSWNYYGVINNLVYVAPTGTNGSAKDGWGLTMDKPWASVRYACQQVEHGYLNQDAASLLRQNKQFIMKELANWVTFTYTIEVTGSSNITYEFEAVSTENLTANMPVSFDGTVGGVTAGTTYYIKQVIDETHFTISNTQGSTVRALTLSASAMTGNLVYDAVKCERDVGLIVDALIFDISHGGNSETIKAARSYFTAAGSAYITSNFGTQAVQTIAAYDYLKELVADVLSNTAPAVNYQTANSASPVAGQFIDVALVSETGTTTSATGLLSIITDGIAAGTATAIPTASQPNTTISVKTGTYFEILPIVVPRNTAIVGDELRGTVVQPQPAIPLLVNDKPKTISALNRIKSVTSDVIQNIAITPTAGNTATQVTTLLAGNVGSTAASAAVVTYADIISDIVDVGAGAIPSFTFTAPTGYNTTFLAGYGDGKAQIVQNYNFIKAEIAAYLNVNYNSVWTALGAGGQANCQRDVGYILDSLQYDMTYGGNTQSLITGSAYYSFSQLTIASTELTATVAAYARLKTIITQVAQKVTVTPTAGNVTAQVTTGTAGSAGSGSFAQDRVQDIIDWIEDGSAPATVAPTAAIALASTALQDAYNALQTKKAEVQSDTVVWVRKYFQNMAFDQATCSRDAGYIVDALSYDTVFGTNFNSVKAGMAYLRNLTSAALVLADQKTAELGAINFIKYKAKTIVASGSVAQISSNIDDITAYITGSTVPEVHGSNTYNNTLGTIKGAEILRANKSFLANEATAWISATFGGTVTTTTASNNQVTTTADHNLSAGDPIVFTGAVFGNLVAGTTYYVLTAPTGSTFTLTDTMGSSTEFALADGSASGTLTVTYKYDATACRRDMEAYIDAIILDLNYVGNYRSLRAAKLYLNAINGSHLSDMYLVRNGTGIRNMTLSGLNGTLSAVNSFGTKRPTAGAYVSLDPGFGPNDEAVWITTRSCYSQNVTMFGTGCTGGKIDGALHAGGNRSTVANDFTTIISDGIGVWVTGSNALTELVSVFNYYGYAGYLAELGGKIRATNGNSSYGTYGVIAEGVDTYETPVYGYLDNRYNPANISNVVTDFTDEVLRFEFANAGTGYTNTVHSISGSGYNATAVGDEFRDGAVFETRIIDKNDGNGVGGTSYVSFANAAQNGDTTSITIAATDTSLSNAYNGMRVQITAGTGVGQYANILTYGGGSKIAQVYKDSFTALTVTAVSTTNNLLTVASTATLTPGSKIYLTTAGNGLTANTLYYVMTANFSATQFSVSLTGAAGTAVTISGNATGLTYSLLAAGWDHVVPGTVIKNNLDLTSTYIIEPRINYSAPGYTATARSTGATATWTSATYADSKYVAIASGGTTTAYSTNGKTWASAGALPSSQTWNDVVYGGGQGAVGIAVVGGLGGTGAVLTATLGTPNTSGAALADQVATVTVVSGGRNYTTPPTIVFTPVSGGIGAVATCTVLDGAIKTVTVTIPGSGYNVPPTVAAATDRVSSVTVDDWGRDYYGVPTVTFGYPAGLTPTAWAATTAVLVNDYLVTEDGNIYIVSGAGTTGTTKPTHTSGSAGNGGATLGYVATQAKATAVLTNNGVSGYTMTNNGVGYTATPTVTITDTNAKFVAISSASNSSAYVVPGSIGSAWTAGGSTGKTDLQSVTYGNGVYVAVGGTSGTASAVSSTDGTTWVSRTPTALSAGFYSAVAYGAGTFVAINNGGTVTSFSSNGTSWSAGGALPSSATWTGLAYGNGRFVAIANGPSRTVAYSIDKGVTWTAASPGLPSSQAWSAIGYGQGLFFAVSTGGTVGATSPDGINWTARTLPTSTNWRAIAFGNPADTPLWVAISNTSSTSAASMNTGAQALGRVKVASGIVTEVRMIEPGSAYPKGTVTATTGGGTDSITVDTTENLTDSQPVEFTGVTAGGLSENVTYYVIGATIVTNTSFKVSATAGSSTPVDLTTATGLTGTYRSGPIFTVTDPNKVKTVALRARLGDGALGNPSFTNRGLANTTATAITAGDGYADLYQPSSYINVYGLFQLPVAGANVEFSSLPGQYFKLVAVTNQLGVAGNYTAQFQINPALTTLQAPQHGDTITTRLNYSQVRLTGHDFLYIGTGNFTQTNYPNVDITTARQNQQELFTGGGRVFFTSTDQDGNFNVGNLFGVQQATGTATLNASAFNLAGLQSLQLGAVSIGVGSAVITQFSTDPYFTANSDNIVPTQRAIKAYITAQIGGGSSALNVNTLTSGVIYVAGNSISTTTGVQINVTSKMNFTGGIDGAPVALGFFLQR